MRLIFNIVAFFAAAASLVNAAVTPVNVEERAKPDSIASGLSGRAAALSCERDTGWWYGIFLNSQTATVPKKENVSGTPQLVLEPTDPGSNWDYIFEPCNSKFMGYKNDPDVTDWSYHGPAYGRLRLTYNTTDCLKIPHVGAPSQTLIAEPCSDKDDASQLAQFWKISSLHVSVFSGDYSPLTFLGAQARLQNWTGHYDYKFNGPLQASYTYFPGVKPKNFLTTTGFNYGGT